MINSVGIISAPRPDGVNYISNSLDSYFREWDIVPWIFEEPGMQSYLYASHCERFPVQCPADTNGDGDCEICVRNPYAHKLGIVRNWIRAAKKLVAESNSSWIMICEDDILWTNGSANIVRSFILDNLFDVNLGCFSAYTCVENAMRDFNQGEWHKPYFVGGMPEHWCGACALIFPYERLRQLVFDWEDELLINAHGADTSPIHLDCAISKTLHDHNLEMKCHSPSLIDHKGIVSTNGGNNSGNIPLSRTPAL